MSRWLLEGLAMAAELSDWEHRFSEELRQGVVLSVRAKAGALAMTASNTTAINPTMTHWIVELSSIILMLSFTQILTAANLADGPATS
jgi:hypothetical protein